MHRQEQDVILGSETDQAGAKRSPGGQIEWSLQLATGMPLGLILACLRRYRRQVDELEICRRRVQDALPRHSLLRPECGPEGLMASDEFIEAHAEGGRVENPPQPQ
jgi:hypothetical protein